MVSVNYFSNSPGSSARPTIFHTDSNGTVKNNGSVEHNQQSCASITDIFYCSKNDRLYFGPYSSAYPLSIYAAASHNNMAITCIRPL